MIHERRLSQSYILHLKFVICLYQHKDEDAPSAESETSATIQDEIFNQGYSVTSSTILSGGDIGREFRSGWVRRERKPF